MKKLESPRNCVKCGTLFSGRECASCKSIRQAKNRIDNHEKLLAIEAAYRNRNEDKVKARGAAWREENKESQKEYFKTLYLKNPDAKKLKAKEWYEKNPDQAKESRAAWKKANPELKRIYEENRRARKINSGGTLSKGLTAKLFKLQKGKCACCGKSLGDNYHLDHQMPLALGGSNTDDNMQLLTQRCNNQKYTKHPVDFMQERGFLL